MADIKLYEIDSASQLSGWTNPSKSLAYNTVLKEIDLDSHNHLENMGIIDKVYKCRDRLKKLDFSNNDITFHMLYDDNIDKIVLLRVDGFCYNKSKEISIAIPDIVQVVPKIDMIFNISGAEKIAVQTVNPVEIIRFYDIVAFELLLLRIKERLTSQESESESEKNPLKRLDLTECETDIPKIEETENLRYRVDSKHKIPDDYSRNSLMDMYDYILKHPLDYTVLEKNDLISWAIRNGRSINTKYDSLIVSQYTFKSLIQTAIENSRHGESEASIAGLFSKYGMRNITCIDIDDEHDEHGYSETQIDVSEIDDLNRLFYECCEIEEINLTKLFKNIQPVRMREAFKYCSSANKIDIRGLDGQRLVDMSSMFHGCMSLDDLRMQGIDTSHVIKMNDMLQDCHSLERLDKTGICDFDTSSLEYTCWMFYQCNSLIDIDLHKWTGTKIKDASDMFKDCHKLQRVDMRNLKLDNLIGYQFMFGNCNNITEIIFGERNIELRASSIYQCSWYFGDIEIGLLDVSKADYSIVKQMIMGQPEVLKDKEFQNSIKRIRVRPEDREKAIQDFGKYVVESV